MIALERIKRIYDEVASVNLAEQATLLHRLCEGDEELIESVRRILKENSSTASLLSVGPLPIWAGQPDSTGERLGPYRLEEKVGQGGMGTVYKGVRVDGAFSKTVAVKVVAAGDRLSIAAGERFLAERQMLARLEHPCIARLLDGGRTDNGLLYLVMEYVEGIPITEYCSRNSLPVNRRLELFRKLCGAVSYAHRNLVVHRDIKPANILVNNEGTPYLLDFGIAKLLEPTQDAYTTQLGHRPMTPQYASPEQISGEPVTVASDVYALGLLLYEILSGSRPYELGGLSLDEQIRVVREANPAALRPGTGVKIPRDLEAIVLQAIRKEPDRRYLSAEALADDVDRFLNGRPVKAAADSLGYRFGKFARRNRFPLAIGALAGLFLIAGVFGTVTQAQIAEAERRKAEKEAAAAIQERTRAESLARREAEERERAERSAREANLQRQEAQEQQQLADSRFQDVRGLATAFLFDFDEAIANVAGAEKGRDLVVTKGVEYLEKLSRDSNRDQTLQQELAAGYERLGDILGNLYLSNQGQYQRARMLYERALSMRERLAKTRPNEPGRIIALAATHAKLADSLIAVGELKPGIREHETALQLLKLVDETRAHGLKQNSHSRLCTLLIPANDLVGAEAHCRAALEPTASKETEKPPPTARAALAAAHSNFAILLRARRQFAEAEPILAQAAAQFSELRAEFPRNSNYAKNAAGAYALLGTTQNELGNREAGVESQLKGISIIRELLKISPEDVRNQITFGFANIRLAPVLLSLGRQTEAESAGRDGLEVFRALAERPSATPDDQNNYASFLLEIGVPSLADPNKALAFAKRATAGVKSPSLAFLDTLAQAHCETGDFRSAISVAERALRESPGTAPGGLAADLSAKLNKFRAGSCK
ncbi:MAG: protein kinase [Bryobacteraceae bacterium]|nr:protein kinase [Bryobacteraceae bacterium]